MFLSKMYKNPKLSGVFGLAVALAIVPNVGHAEPSAATSAQVFRPPPAKEGFSYPDCYCTDSKGGRVEMGERACLTIGDRSFVARCDMSLNNPTWRTEREGCPVS